MTEPVPPRILADVGGLVVAERGPFVVVVDRGTGAWATLAFVLGVVASVFGLFGLITLAVGAAAVPRASSAAFVLVGLVFAAAVFAVLGRIRRAREKPLGAYRPVAVFDRSRRLFLDADGTTVAALDQVRFERQTQLTSSSPMLVALTPSGKRILKRGNPFNGGLGDLDGVLTAAVFGGAR